MKQISHKERPYLYRVIQRGSKFYFQRHTNIQGSRTDDPWIDDAPAKDTMEAAVALMYSRHPVVKP